MTAEPASMKRAALQPNTCPVSDNGRMSDGAGQTISEFLRARLDEDETVARAVDLKPDKTGLYQKQAAGGLFKTYRPRVAEFYVSRVLRASSDGMPQDRSDEPATAAFAKFGPARALADIEAKRAILDEYDSVMQQLDAEYTPYAYGAGTYLNRAVRRFATVYSDHPDYQQDWASL